MTMAGSRGAAVAAAAAAAARGRLRHRACVAPVCSYAVGGACRGVRKTQGAHFSTEGGEGGPAMSTVETGEGGGARRYQKPLELWPKPKGQRKKNHPDTPYTSERKRYRRALKLVRKKFELEYKLAQSLDDRAQMSEYIQNLKNRDRKNELKRIRLEEDAERRELRRLRLQKERQDYLQERKDIRDKDERQMQTMRGDLVSSLSEERAVWMSSRSGIQEKITDELWAKPGSTAGPDSQMPGSKYWRYNAFVDFDEARRWLEADGNPDSSDEEDDLVVEDGSNWLQRRMKERQWVAMEARRLMNEQVVSKDGFENDTRDLTIQTDLLAKMLLELDSYKAHQATTKFKDEGLLHSSRGDGERSAWGGDRGREGAGAWGGGGGGEEEEDDDDEDFESDSKEGETDDEGDTY